MMLETHNSTLS